jgi:hypothetical protein
MMNSKSLSNKIVPNITAEPKPGHHLLLWDEPIRLYRVHDFLRVQIIFLLDNSDMDAMYTKKES